MALVDPVIQAFGQQRRLLAIRSLNETLHPIPHRFSKKIIAWTGLSHSLGHIQTWLPPRAEASSEPAFQEVCGSPLCRCFWPRPVSSCQRWSESVAICRSKSAVRTQAMEPPSSVPMRRLCRNPPPRITVQPLSSTASCSTGKSSFRQCGARECLEYNLESLSPPAGSPFNSIQVRYGWCCINI